MQSVIYAQIESLLAQLPQKIDLELHRLQNLLQKLGHPHSKIPPIFHIAGTNGKGSTAAFLRSILEHAGYKVHVFTSPHLVSYQERIRIAGHFISEVEFLSGLQHVVDTMGEEQVTIFEAITALAFHVFAQHEADFTILEVGLGGEFDATNVITAPLVSIISPISFDHKEFLGDTLTSITQAKAGIIKSRCPVVSAVQPLEVRTGLYKQAMRKNTHIKFGEEDWHINFENGRLIYQDESGLLDLDLPQKLLGMHQFSNAGLAIAALRAVKDLAIPERAFREGVARASWPARLQILKSGHLLEIFKADTEIWLDGAHNEAGAMVAAQFMSQCDEKRPKPLHMVVGMLSNKDAQAFFATFTDLCQIVWTIPIDGAPNSFAADKLAHLALNAGLNAVPCKSLQDALQKIAQNYDARVLITGSLYLAGEVLKANGTHPQ